MDLGLTFGSVGDFIAITVLIKDIVAALDDARGSAKEYQDLVRELDTLSLTLEEVQRTFEDPHLIHSLEDLVQIALDTVARIHECLNGFLGQICKYEPTLSTGASGKRNCLKAVGRKVQWKLNEREVGKFRAEVMGCTNELNVLLKVITMLQAVRKSGIELKRSVDQIIAMMCAISGDLSSIRAIVMRLDRGPNDEYFILEDITGRTFPIHLRTITSWPVLEFILSERFKGKKGARRVQRKLYSLRESNTQREIDGSMPWESAFLPHQKITMSLTCKDTENNNTDGRGLASCPFCKTSSDHSSGVEVECAKCKRYFTRVVELDDPDAPHDHPIRPRHSILPSERKRRENGLNSNLKEKVLPIRHGFRHGLG
ncbi:vegetative cell wall protein gp1 [Fusarium flagelliforme]|uniref:Vegetative cell wall protein gp1 n=1 Tax=Fusarium flagelliforme TaxID=2675880 RepID=A0A395MJI2_9HYPO|nr:vegetative cell wall protein gp1 [Fusarium flagelliforme]